VQPLRRDLSGTMARLSLLYCAATALAAPTVSVDLFEAWKAKHGKAYSTVAGEAKALATFMENEAKIVAHNSLLGRSYELGHNEFSDLTADEFYSQRLGFNATAARVPGAAEHVPTPLSDLPDAIDWVAKGAVTPVKNQGQCGSCWSFSATGSMEGAYQIASGKLVSLSEEVLVQCDTVDQGCQGGLMDNAFKFAEANGIAAEEAYPYTSGTGIRGLCDKAKEAVPVVHVTGFTDVKSGDEAALQSAVAIGPVSVAIEADKSAFQLYKSGVLDSFMCGTKLDHGVLVVGYGTSTGIFSKDYWKVKNSWGATWGEEGYIRMVRGKNMCGIATQPSYPTGAAAGKPSVVEA